MYTGRCIYFNNITEDYIVRKWYSLCCEIEYAWNIIMAELFSPCRNDYLYFVLTDASSVFALEAFITPLIFEDTSSSSNEQYEARAYLHYVDGKGFGFSSLPSINLRACDDGRSKCWHSDSDSRDLTAISKSALKNDLEWLLKVMNYIEISILKFSSLIDTVLFKFLNSLASVACSEAVAMLTCSNGHSYNQKSFYCTENDLILRYDSASQIILCGSYLGYSSVPDYDITRFSVVYARNMANDDTVLFCTPSISSEDHTYSLTYSLRQGCKHRNCNGVSRIAIHDANILSLLTFVSFVVLCSTTPSRIPTNTPYRAPTLTPTKYPTPVPTISHPPTYLPTISKAPTILMTISCPPYFSEGSYYSYYVPCIFTLCEVKALQISLCGSCDGTPTMLQLYDTSEHTVGLYSTCSDGTCSKLTYSILNSGCANYSLHQGCWYGYCYGSSQITVTDGVALMLSTPNPTVMPTLTLTSIPTVSFSPTLTPTISQAPTTVTTVYCRPFTSTTPFLLNYVPCYFIVCNAKTLRGSLCGSCTGQTFLTLYDSTGSIVARNSGCADRTCSELSYDVPSSLSCNEYSLYQGCDYGSCGGTSRILVLGGTIYLANASSQLPNATALSSNPTANPTYHPTFYPTKRPTFSPTFHSTARPTSFDSAGPTSLSTSSILANGNSNDIYIYPLIFVLISILACCLFFCLCFYQSRRREVLARDAFLRYVEQVKMQQSMMENDADEDGDADGNKVVTNGKDMLSAREQFCM